jgi:phage replication-related protein YjqB (UPF0714/DUF867 family)
METVLEKTKSYQEAQKIVRWLQNEGFSATVSKNTGILSGKYPYNVVGPNKASAAVEEAKARKNVITGETPSPSWE